ncbi:MBL fold metallo-hydrolase [Viridibacillus sp. YIM B01967]|uniref:MBL fold metallo-hydrolase n=1 Tax=Viridibacillus soli TaxID=2798301 RepID=A0ABS1HA04_9BACL|nr:MBL fold metallo-hydrolase [Viridibacillus soli]MBK3496254.1 MBL fold metallo-hydrolase [Viridibacillus soli]
MLNVEILGGVGEYGRNCFYIENEGHAILLDCGIMNNTEKITPKLTKAHVAKLDAVFISHSHIDHTGALPMLEILGYTGEIFMSKMTARQLKQSFKNTKIFQPESFGKWLRVSDYLHFQWGYSGHLVGSVWYKIQFLEGVIFFSGDYVMDSYLLNATLPIEDGTIYDVALIDSGHVEKQIRNLDVLQQIKNYINEHPSRPIIFPSSFSGKTADIATYLFRHTAREMNIDKVYFSFFEEYYDSPDNLLPTKYEAILKLFKKDCFREKAESDNAIYFVPEVNEWRIDELLQEHPTAIVIFTGYLKNSGFLKKLVENGDQSKLFFYKTHLDYLDIMEFSKKMNATETIFFHSQLTNMETTYSKLVENEEGII